MSMNGETDGSLKKNDCKENVTAEIVHSTERANHNKERLRRPDKALYVPRALRGVQHEKEKEDGKNNFTDASSKKHQAHTLNDRFNGDDGLESTFKPDVPDDFSKHKPTEKLFDSEKVHEQMVIHNGSNHFSHLKDEHFSHDDTSLCGKEVKNAETPSGKIKHKLCSGTEDKQEVERIKFSYLENDSSIQISVLEEKSGLKLYQDGENNFDLKEKEVKHSDFKHNTKSSKSKQSGKSKSVFTNKYHSVKENHPHSLSLNKKEKKENSLMIASKNEEEIVTNSVVESLRKETDACSSKNSENSKPRVESNKQNFSDDKNVLMKSDSVERAPLFLEKSADSWEAKFNEEGECLEPNTLEELCKVAESNHFQVTKTATDYESFSDTKSRENENIVELFDFPVEFTTPDLMSALSLFQKENYTIKWVDDCHALAVFTSPTLANQALIMRHPFVKIRALSEATKESKAKARYCANLHESSKPRPMTTATLARRLVSGALGIKNYVSKEQQDVEQKLLREAREKKKLKAKQKQDIWDGIVSKN